MNIKNDFHPHRLDNETKQVPLVVDIDEHLSKAPESPKWREEASTLELIRHGLEQAMWQDWVGGLVLLGALIIGVSLLT